MSWQEKFLVFRPGYAEDKSQNQRAWLVLVLVFFAAMYFSPYFRFKVLSFFEYPFHYKEYRQFGIRIPNGYQVHGIDVSRYQRKVTWERVTKMQVGKIRITFAFIKATEGTSLKDPEFENNWKNAKEAGVIRGAYHYFLPNISPKDQAAKFVQTVRLRSGDLPPVVDVEETRGMTKAQIQKYTKEFLDLLEKHYNVKPILYTNRDFYKRYFVGHEDFKGYRFWIAHFHVTNFSMPGDENWHFWQHSDRGNINGITERVDFNVFNGSSDALRKLCVP
jgi:lysozyme